MIKDFINYGTYTRTIMSCLLNILIQMPRLIENKWEDFNLSEIVTKRVKDLSSANEFASLLLFIKFSDA